jgi:hypothetical protein
MIVLQHHFNVQNDRVWSETLRDVPREKLTISVMVWATISKNGRPLLDRGVLNEREVKINAEYKKTEVLEKHLLPAAQTLYREENFYFQQDKAPSYWYVVILALGRYCNAVAWN